VITSVFGGVNGFFHSATWYAIAGAVGIFFVLFWIATIAWVRKDAKRRIKSPSLVNLMTLIGAVPPFLGPLIYMLFRPPEYLEDVRERALEIEAIERRLGSRECPRCHAEVDADFLVCPSCTTRLRQPCVNCQRPLEATWLVCPYCEATVGRTENTLELRPPPPAWPSRASSRKGT
jgi:RNA polymerase subunit RPABC4/transcription elongation factor Spt4